MALDIIQDPFLFQNDLSLCEDYVFPFQNYDLPFQNDDSLFQNDDSPFQDDVSLFQNDASPSQDDKSPSQDDKSPSQDYLSILQNCATVVGNLAEIEHILDQPPNSLYLRLKDLIKFSQDLDLKNQYYLDCMADMEKREMYTFDVDGFPDGMLGLKYPIYLDSNDNTIPDFKKRDVLDQDLADPQNPEMFTMMRLAQVSGDYGIWEMKMSKIKMSEAEAKQWERMEKATKAERLNNGYSDNEEKEPHEDHSYYLVSKKLITPLVIAPVVVPEAAVEVPQAPRRPVGRPRKCAATPKRYAADMEEMVDVESMQAKRPRRAPKAKPAVSAPPKRRGRKPNNGESSSSYKSQAVASCSYVTDSNGFVMRQAKNSALKKIAKAKSSSTVSRSKRNDHNDMERRRRHEMKVLFDQLKVLVPTQLLKDANGKMKKNPSKNTILIGSRKLLVNTRAGVLQKIYSTNEGLDVLRRNIKQRLMRY